VELGELELVPFGEDQLGAAAALFVEAFAGEPWHESWARGSARRRLSNVVLTPDFVGVSAFRDGELVGFALGRLEPYRDEEHFLLQEMCVAPQLQRRGIGTSIMRYLHETLSNIGCHQAYLLTARDSLAAAFYAQNGYSVARRTGLFVKRLDV